MKKSFKLNQSDARNRVCQRRGTKNERIIYFKKKIFKLHDLLHLYGFYQLLKKE